MNHPSNCLAVAGGKPSVAVCITVTRQRVDLRNYPGCTLDASRSTTVASGPLKEVRWEVDQESRPVLTGVLKTKQLAEASESRRHRRRSKPPHAGWEGRGR